MRSKQEWRCSQCGKLLGVLKGERLHIKFARCHEYLVGFPATGVCRNCGTLNEHPSVPDLKSESAAVRR